VLVGNLLRVEALPQALRERVLAYGEGNPFYVEEILRSLIDRGAVVHDEVTGRWSATRDVSDLAIPDTLHGVIAARIDRLPGEARHVLQMASVLGRIFSYPLLAAIASPPPVGQDPPTGGHPKGGEGGSLDAHLLSLQRAQLIRERARLPEREYAFKHVLTQEAAYNGLLRRERRAIHRRAAEALERLYSERLEEQLGVLAHHWEGAGEAERAVRYLRQAGEQAADQYANEEAIDYLSRALALVPGEDAATRYALLIAREGVYDVQAAREAQGRDVAALKEAAEELAGRDIQGVGREGKRRLAEVALREAIYAHKTRDEAAEEAALGRAISLAQEVRDVGLEAAVYLEWGRSPGLDTKARISWLERALTLARTAGRRRIEADCLRELGMRASDEGDYATARVYQEQALRVYQKLGDRWGEGRVLNVLALVRYSQGDFAGGIVYSEQGLRLCRETGNRYDEAWAIGQIGWGLHLQGDHAEAKTHLEHALHICREIGAPLTEAIMLTGLGVTMDALGDWVEAEACYERAWSTYPTGRVQQSGGLVNRSLLCHHRGDDEAARRYAQRVLDYYSEHSENPSDQASALTALGHALAGLGDRDGAAGAYRQALDLYRGLGQDHLAPEPLAGLARAAQALGEPKQALAHAQEILRCLETRPGLEGTWEPLRVYLTCYQVLRAHDDPRAQEVLDAAYHLLQERAFKIDDGALRRSYLENVAAHREIAGEWKRLNPGKRE
jgi:tetratricopeptide (TPR) repeat protein